VATFDCSIILKINIMKKALLPLLMAIGIINNAQGQCSAPTGLSTSYSNNVTTFTWSPVTGATDYVIEAKQSWDDWMYAEVIDTISTNTYTLTGIMHSLSIDWRVKTLCAGSASSFTATSFVIPCPQPSSLTTSSVSMTGATIGWTAAPGYNTYVSDFATSYRKSGATTWTSLSNTSGTSKTLTGLQANTTYEWRVTQTCPYFNSSAVTSTFTTLACNSYGTNGTEWISRFKLGGINRSSGAESGGYANINSTASLSRGNSHNGQIQVGYSGGFTNKVFKIYIDYNNNTIYEETELVYGPTNITSGGNINFTVSISSTAPTGTHGMRIIMARTGTTINGCLTGFNGETEDYKVNITGTGSKEEEMVTEIEAAEKISVFPNPATNNVKIQLPENVTVVNVYDIMGKRVYQQQATNGVMQIDVVQWPATQYIVEAIYADGHKDMARFVKQ
jgi:hypothetical protein